MVHTGSFAPVTLEQLAREHGVLRSDRVSSCIQPKEGVKEGARQVLLLLARAADSSDSDQCIVRPFGRETTTSSFALYTFSIAVFTQALVLITFSPVADYGKYQQCPTYYANSCLCRCSPEEAIAGFRT